LGHVISFRPGVQKAFDKLVIDKHIKPITWYAASDPPNELFPEAFALYYGDPEWLRTNWPDLFNFFDALDKQAPAAAKPPARSAGAKR
jgi:Mlc titration factor MtfA (ptsG expression regulator)